MAADQGTVQRALHGHLALSGDIDDRLAEFSLAQANGERCAFLSRNEQTDGTRCRQGSARGQGGLHPADLDAVEVKQE